MNDSYRLNKLTDCDWVNLFDVRFKHKGQPEKSWVMCSRKEKPIEDAAKADAVVIIPTIETDEGIRLVVTKEFRVPIWDYEYGFPAGLIDTEDIEVLFLDVQGIRDLLASGRKIAAKAWGLLYHYVQTGRID